MSADVLRRAAAKLRETANAADFGPWEVGPSFGARDNRVYVRQEGDLIDSVGTCVIAGQVANKTRFRENASYIALMHPPVALALADWLESEAALLGFLGDNARQQGIAVARAVLREDGEQR